MIGTAVFAATGVLAVTRRGLDLFGAGLFGVQATERVLMLQFGATIAVAMGVLTSIGGGLIRDVLAGRPTLLMSREIYATPILVGCTIYAVLRGLPIGHGFLSYAVIVFIFCLRASAIRWHIEMPVWLTSNED